MNASHHRQRGAAVLALAGAGALALTGCSANQPAPDDEGTAVVEEIAWEDCEDGMQCATVQVPLDWADPDGESIDLAIARLPSTGDAPQGSLVFNPGGPGAGAIDTVIALSDGYFSAELREAYDIVALDPRGVGRSTQVECLDDAERDAYLYPEAVEESEAVAAAATAAEDFAAACATNSGDLLPFITTEQAARDMDHVRSLLREDQLDYLGVSYGTYLGATYADLFPQNVGRMVLDAAVDPTIDAGSLYAEQQVGFESALRAYVTACLESEDCPLSGSPDDAMSQVADQIETLSDEPLVAADGREVNGNTLWTAIVTALYDVQTWPVLTAALAGVDDGDPSVALMLADAMTSRNPDGTYAETRMDFEAQLAYNCMDRPAATDAEIEAANAIIEADAPAFGVAYTAETDACTYWPSEPTGTTDELTAAGAAPIVVVGTTNDPATPYEWSASLAQQLESGVHVTRVGEGHGAYGMQNACLDAAVDAFLIDGTVPEDGLTCE